MKQFGTAIIFNNEKKIFRDDEETLKISLGDVRIDEVTSVSMR